MAQRLVGALVYGLCLSPLSSLLSSSSSLSSSPSSSSCSSSSSLPSFGITTTTTTTTPTRLQFLQQALVQPVGIVCLVTAAASPLVATSAAAVPNDTDDTEDGPLETRQGTNCMTKAGLQDTETTTWCQNKQEIVVWDDAVARQRPCTEPPGVSFQENPTVFGDLLRGDIASRAIAETAELYCFHDKYPQAPLHALIIPKEWIPSVWDLTPQDLPRLQQMQNVALYVVQRYSDHQNDDDDDYVACFHIPPFNSISHLHLHVMAPASQLSHYQSRFRYSSNQVSSIRLEQVMERLQHGQSPVPPLPWGWYFRRERQDRQVVVVREEEEEGKDMSKTLVES